MPGSVTPASAAAWAADAARGLAGGAADVLAMLRGISTDPRVSHAAKVEATAALAYLASGKARIPRFIPVVGRIDDLAVAAFALRRLLGAAGEPVLRSHWNGSSRGLQNLLALSAALATPGGRLRALAVAGAAASAVREQVTTPGGLRRRPGSGRVVEGEVLARREYRR
ncbi:MAG TPA: DUF1232 domain-containing protein [Frankiaceae bacterium]|nr:DUF1232 domain-containing protein [Frankiaceae bacterium]